jgi:hypothetical protein
LHAVVALVGDLRRVDVGQPAARQPRLQVVQPVARDVEGVQPPGVAHGRAQRQRLAAGAGTEVHHHLAALGVGDGRASSWLPSSCTSTIAAAVNTSSLCSAGLPCTRRPQGECGVGCDV